MKSQKRVCDNPTCGTEAHPEEVKPYVAPYGWVTAKGLLIGEMRYNIEVCSGDCLTPAFNEALRLHYLKTRNG